MDALNYADLLRQGAAAWNRYRSESGEVPVINDADLRRADLAGADLSGGCFTNCQLQGADLRGASMQDTMFDNSDLSATKLCDARLQAANFLESTLIGADLNGADLRGAEFREARLPGADLRKARFDALSDFDGADLRNVKLEKTDLSGVIFSGADLSRADLTGANLCGAKLDETSLIEAKLTNADLSQADLQHARLVRTGVNGARFTGARVYGTSAWDLEGTPADESALVITPAADPAITVNDLEVAQFVYLLINNAKIRDVIDTVTAKAVLILGRFSAERKAILDKIRDLLAHEDYVPIIFDFDKPATRDLTETVRTLAHLSRFIIADITDPKSIPQELTTIIPQLPSVPVQPLLLEGKDEWAMLKDLKRTGQVLETFVYRDLGDVSAQLRQKILEPAESWLQRYSQHEGPLQALHAMALEAEEQRRENERLREDLRQLRMTGGAGTG